jgi:hypothetical protein
LEELKVELMATGGKCLRAAKSMQALILDKGPDHDKVLDFHRYIGRSNKSAVAPDEQVRPVKSWQLTVPPTNHLTAIQVAPIQLAPAQLQAEPATHLPFTVVQDIPVKQKFQQAIEIDNSKAKLNELQHWFENYGRNGLIVQQSVPSTSEDISKSA